MEMRNIIRGSNKEEEIPPIEWWLNDSAEEGGIVLCCSTQSFPYSRSVVAITKEGKLLKFKQIGKDTGLSLDSDGRIEETYKK